MFNKTLVSVGVAVAAVLGLAGFAGATPPTPTEQVTTMATDAAADLIPIILGVGGALVTVAALRFGVRWVLRSVGNGGRG
jgi:hypothetical protein